MNTNVTELAKSGTVPANVQELYYELHGDGPPLVLVMGIGYDSSLWTLAQVPVLSTQFQVIWSTTATPAAARKPASRTPSPTWRTTSPVCSTP